MANSWWDDYKTAEGLVKKILAEYPDTRGNDINLFVKVWEEQGLKLTEAQKHLFSLVCSPETISRSRRKIQESGLFRPIGDIYEGRQLLSEDVRKNI